MQDHWWKIPRSVCNGIFKGTNFVFRRSVFLSTAFLTAVRSAAVALFTTQWILLLYQCRPKAVSFIQQADDAWLTTLFQFSKRRIQMYVSPKKNILICDSYASITYCLRIKLTSKVCNQFLPPAVFKPEVDIRWGTRRMQTVKQRQSVQLSLNRKWTLGEALGVCSPSNNDNQYSCL